ncbi:subtilisin-like protease [Colletotrichum truncatum]|uniref:Subtilisin-like protease n=1 Tax=Colletotrichum truncatum TaxID=5467 RepID=A0ACC3Z8P7_COLTU|nr:subtilisin-like protease [Colletotrichum truncatum]KAF6789262.1 subtilisin-like protease [Colletotrichum truncatum]
MATLLWIYILGLLACFAEGARPGPPKRTYIVRLRKPLVGTPAALQARRPQSPGDAATNPIESLPIDTSSIIYNYTSSTTGFSAQLTDAEVAALQSNPDVVAISTDTVFRLHTSRTPQFLGLVSNDELLGGQSSPNVQRDTFANSDYVSSVESNIVVGVFDTGAWPELPSYSDVGMGPIPSHWKGKCEEGEEWTSKNCNKKLIGARYYYQGFLASLNETEQTFNWTGLYRSARDSEGHGTHTSTTIAGAHVANASLYGQASGTARGMATGARLAIYKVCWRDGCFNSDILKALDDAIEDGVNITSFSLGGDPDYMYPEDWSVGGSFAAMERGILVSASAGNSGPGPYTVSNIAPWVMTVAASTLDRDFPAVAILGNGQNYTGTSIYAESSVGFKSLPTGRSPLIWAGDASLGNITAANLCLNGSLAADKVAGKIIVCERGENGRVEKGGVLKDLGARGMVLTNDKANGGSLISDAHVLPAVHISYEDGVKVAAYAKSGNATATMDFEGTRYGVPAPGMAGFSSRGPNSPDPKILKPDITGPGVSILAGWTQDEAPSGLAGDVSRSNFNIISGTSMSCPHLSGIAAFIMARRPSWSIAAIKSAIMTTAYTTLKGSRSSIIDEAGGDATPFAYGNGHVDPIAALNPGLVYDITTEDYIAYACAYNSSDSYISSLTRSNTTNCDTSKKYSQYDLNYPSFSAFYDTTNTNGTLETQFRRTVTSVNGAGTYKAQFTLTNPSLVSVTVEPSELTFGATGEKQSYVLTAKLLSNTTAEDIMETGSLVWSDGSHTVHSSLAFLWTTDGAPVYS